MRHKKYRSIEIAELIQLGDIQEKISSEKQQLTDLQAEYNQRIADYTNKYQELENNYKQKESSLKKDMKIYLIVFLLNQKKNNKLLMRSAMQ